MLTADYLSGVSIDCVIFGFHQNELKILLLKLKNLDKWALPGGFIRKDEDVDEAAKRVLKRRTGLDNIFLQQFHLFGNVSRSDAGHADFLVQHKIISENLKDWFAQRFVSIGFYALVEYERVKMPQPDDTSDLCEWCSMKDLPDLFLDHKEITQKAYEHLKKELRRQPIGLNLLPEMFTMTELQSLYETLLARDLDRRNFRRKMLSYDILINTGERRTGGPHKAPILYRFDKKKYFEAIDRGLDAGFLG